MITPEGYKEFRDKIEECVRDMFEVLTSLEKQSCESHNFKLELKQQAVDIDFEEIKTEEI